MNEKDKIFDIINKINIDNPKLEDGEKFEKVINKIIQTPSYFSQ
jgi:hypothetical protein